MSSSSSHQGFVAVGLEELSYNIDHCHGEFINQYDRIS